jgi:urease accessory protein
LAFVGAMVVGAVLGFQQVALPHAELGIAASVLVLGLGIVMADRGMSPWPITALVAFFGALHGLAHGAEIPGSASPALYTLGFVISTSVLHIFGMIIGEVATMQSWLRQGLRATGVAVTLSGVAFLLQSFSAAA